MYSHLDITLMNTRDSKYGSLREVEAGANQLAQVILGASHLAQSVIGWGVPWQQKCAWWATVSDFDMSADALSQIRPQRGPIAAAKQLA